MKKEKLPVQQEVITRGSLTGSKKIYIKGKLNNISVAMREIALTETVIKNNGSNKTQTNLPVTVYDTSGPYTDDNVSVDISQGLPKLREQWISDRKDTIQLDEHSSDFAKERQSNSALDEIRFPNLPKSRKAQSGRNVTQMHYAKKGIITPEME
ncbi:MAG: hypothetical protein ACK452_11020 [Bacteroidota bacterium]